MPDQPSPPDLTRTLAALLWAGAGAVPLGGAAAHLAGWQVDGLGLAMASLTLFVGAVVASFSRRYLRADPHRGRYFIMLGLLLGAVLLTVTARHLALFIAGWVASGQLLAGLIGHDHGWPEARAAARRARLAFALGDAALITGLALLAGGTGTLQVGELATANLPAPVATLAALLLLAGAAARCALPPFAGWLLSSMTAPTPVSALMHAGLVNAGGFLLLRFAPLFEGAPLVRHAALLLGLAAVVQGHAIMLVRPDIKRALAGSTVAQMGFMVISCALGAYGAALWHIIAHGLFKAWLFLGSGGAVGVRRAPLAVRPGAALGSAALIFAGALLLVPGARAAGGLIPLLLAALTMLNTAIACLAGRQPLRVRAPLLLGLAALAAAQALGLVLAGALIGREAPPALPTPALLVLLVGFIATWLWQARPGPLPAALYVRLLNAGTPTPKGDA
ncbi:MAG: oxidoreductase [Proteobacteria bacterium]|nr:oxidoreductase [Pseudomonadota bacterium]